MVIFRRAITRPEAQRPLTRLWETRTRQLEACPIQSFVAALGTALLGKAARPQIDALALKLRAGERGWTPRTLCEEVVVPLSREFGVHLGRTGPQPFNNNTLFRHDRFAPDMVVVGGAQPYVDLMVTWLSEVDGYTADQAEAALAGFVVARRLPTLTSPPLTGKHLALRSLAPSIERLLREHVEEGRSGQGLVAGLLDLVFERGVTQERVNSPSRHWPGDVHVHRERARPPMLSAEVKQKPVADADIEHFVEQAATVGTLRCLYAALAPNQLPIDSLRLRGLAWERHRAVISVFSDVPTLLDAALVWCAYPLDEALDALPRAVDSRLRELEFSVAGLRAWADLFPASRSLPLVSPSNG